VLLLLVFLLLLLLVMHGLCPLHPVLLPMLFLVS
jgi:hypothetical protein